jgi:hypothetical protein
MRQSSPKKRSLSIRNVDADLLHQSSWDNLSKTKLNKLEKPIQAARLRQMTTMWQANARKRQGRWTTPPDQ